MTKSIDPKTRSAAETRRLRLLSAVSLLSVSLGVTLDVTPAAAASSGAGAGAPANGQSLYLHSDGIKGEAKFHKGQTAIQDNSHPAGTQIKGDAFTVKLDSHVVKGEGKSVKLNSNLQKGDMP